MLRTAAIALALTLPAAQAGAQSAAHAAVQTQAPAQGARDLLYRLDWGPVSLAEISACLVDPAPDADRAEGAEPASLTISAQSQGVASLLFDFSLSQHTERQGNGVRRFRSQGDFDGKPRNRLVIWDGSGAAPEVDFFGDPPEDELTPVPAEALPRSVDPGTALLALMDQIAAGEGCEGSWKIYDGVRMMDLIVRDEGPDMIEADRDWTYAGPALRCRVGFNRVGGFRVDKPPKTDEADFDRLLWIADLEAGPTPVRLQVSWPLGYATARIVQE